MCDDSLVQSLVISLTPSIFSLVSSCDTINEKDLPKYNNNNITRSCRFSSSVSTLQEYIGPHLKNNVCYNILSCSEEIINEDEDEDDDEQEG